MTIRVHIDRLVLEGMPVTPAEGHVVQQVVEQELARLLTEGDLSPGISCGGVYPSLRPGSMRVSHGSPHEIGNGIARAVYRGIGR
jgi:hypothetical protein